MWHAILQGNLNIHQRKKIVFITSAGNRELIVEGNKAPWGGKQLIIGPIKNGMTNRGGTEMEREPRMRNEWQRDDEK